MTRDGRNLRFREKGLGPALSLEFRASRETRILGSTGARFSTKIEPSRGKIGQKSKIFDRFFLWFGLDLFSFLGQNLQILAQK